MQLRIDPEFRDKIPPLTDAEFEQLRENILNDGEVYEPIAVWNGTIVDGHNRYKIVQEHPEIPYRIKEMDFSDKWAAFEWMYKKQLGRRNLTDEQRMMLIGKMYEARKHCVGAPVGNDNAKKQLAPNGPIVSGPNSTAKAIAAEIGVGVNSVKRAGEFAKGVEVIREESPEAAEKILQGNSGVTKGIVQEVPKMEPEKVKTLADAIVSGSEETRRVVREFKEPVKMEDMNATPLNPDPYNEEDFREQVMSFPKETDDMIRHFLMVHGDMLTSEKCSKAFGDMLNGIIEVAEKYRKEYLK